MKTFTAVVIAFFVFSSAAHAHKMEVSSSKKYDCVQVVKDCKVKCYYNTQQVIKKPYPQKPKPNIFVNKPVDDQKPISKPKPKPYPYKMEKGACGPFRCC